MINFFIFKWLSAITCLNNLKSIKEEKEANINDDSIITTTAIKPQENENNNKNDKINKKPFIVDDKLLNRLKLSSIMYSQHPISKYSIEAIKPRALLYYVPIKANNKNINRQQQQQQIMEYAPLHMSYRTLSIGTNENCDLCLNKYEIKCEYTSNKHACIYYDEYTNHYELLNYSENGTMVDNILFSNDISYKIDITDNELNVVKNENNNSNGNESEDQNDDDDDHDVFNSIPKMSSKKLSNTSWSCKCDSSLTDKFNGKCWEGSAILNHGSHIKFGCLEFVFCIVNYDDLR